MQPTIQLGYDGMATQELRAALAHHGFHPTYSVLTPNLFDAWVDAAVRAFQKMAGLSVDGVVGPNTWNALYGRAGIPSTTPQAGAGAAQLLTQPDPGKLPTELAPPGGAQGGSMMPMLLGLGAIGALWLWWKKKKGGSLAGLPFGNSEDDADAREDARKARERARRETAQRIDRITEQYNIELKRLDIDPTRRPGHAQALMNRIARADDKDAELDAKLMREQADAIARQFDPVRRAEVLREQDADIKERTDAERAQARRDMRIMRPELKGRSKKPTSPTYKQEHMKTGRRSFPGTSPSENLRHRTDREDEVWLERVDAGKAAPQATKRITVSSKRYHADRKYRESEQAEARRIADSEKREVRLVNERGLPLYTYQPNVRNFKGAGRSPVDIEIDRASKADGLVRFYRNPKTRRDLRMHPDEGEKQAKRWERERDDAMKEAERLENSFKGGAFKDITSERLIESVEADAIKRNCPKAVRNLFKVRPLALGPRAETKLDNAADAVKKNCSEDLDALLEFEAEAGEEAGGARLTSLTRASLPLPKKKDRGASATMHEERAHRHRKFTVKAIRREIEKGNISKEEGAELLKLAKDYQRSQETGRQMVFDPPRHTARHLRKRKGEKDAEVLVYPSGKRHTRRVS
jgi:hypothetical protein